MLQLQLHYNEGPSYDFWNTITTSTGILYYSSIVRVPYYTMKYYRYR